MSKAGHPVDTNNKRRHSSRRSSFDGTETGLKIKTRLRNTHLNLALVKGYNTGVVDTNEHCDAPHDAGPLPLEFVWLSQVAVQAGIQEAHNSCEKSEKNRRELCKMSRNSLKGQQNMHFYFSGSI